MKKNILLLIFTLIIILLLTISFNAFNTLAQPNKGDVCRSCHQDVYEKKYSFTHPPFEKKQCDKCHLKEADEYKQDEKSQFITTGTDNFAIQHQIRLTNLSPRSDYGFRIRAEDPNGNIQVSKIFNFSSNLTNLGSSFNDKFNPSPIKGDNIPPKISKIKLVRIKKGVLNQVAISWVTDEPSNSQIVFGVTKKLENFTPLDVKMVTSHELVLNNISFETTYYYKIKSIDQNGNLATSEEQTFNVKDISNIINNKNIEIKDIRIDNSASKSARISWETEGYCDTFLLLGKDKTYDLFSYYDSAYTQHHKILIPDLSSETNYSIKIKSSTLDNKTDVAEKVFTTSRDKEGPLITDIKILDLSPRECEIRWITDEMADSQIIYGQDLNYKMSSNINQNIEKIHRIKLVGLEANTSYYFKVKSQDIYNNYSISESNIFITMPTVGSYELNIDDVQITKDNNELIINCKTSQMCKIVCEYETFDKFEEFVKQESGERKHGLSGLNDLKRGGMEVCSECHPPKDLGLSHPVGISSESEKSHIPKDLPTGENGMILCITCHDPHGAEQKKLARLAVSKDLCVACHKEEDYF
ncbi:MAG: cytochrome c3 family protein [bacterium]